MSLISALRFDPTLGSLIPWHNDPRFCLDTSYLYNQPCQQKMSYPRLVVTANKRSWRHASTLGCTPEYAPGTKGHVGAKEKGGRILTG